MDYDYSLYSDYGSYGTSAYDSAAMAGVMGAMGAVLGVVMIISLVIGILTIVGYWQMFKKAGYKGWEAIVPFYNIYIMLQMVARPTWWILLFFVPMANTIFGVILMYDLAKAFGGGVGTTLGMLFLGPIFPMILGFGSAKYTKPEREETAI